MDTDVVRMGDNGWSIRVADSEYSSFVEVSYLRVTDGWTQAQVDGAADMLTQVTSGVRKMAYDSGYQTGREDKATRLEDELEGIKEALADAQGQIQRYEELVKSLQGSKPI